MSEKALLLGNQAIARGAWEAGVHVAVAYPGTPSTEITETIAQYDEVQAQWAPNEKVALETAVGASIAGARVLCCFKHVGLNVAADPLFTASYTGVRGGLVIVVADDPGMHSSQNEQDSRYYARASHVPMLEPSDSAEALAFTKLAFALSEQYDTPVFVRTTTRVSHARSVVEQSARQEVPLKAYEKDASKYVMLPGFARARHQLVEARDKQLAQDGASMACNRIEQGRDDSLGIITSSVAYQYVKEAMPEASALKLGLTYPFPVALAKEFAAKVGRLVVVEELEPYIEEQLKINGISCEGKNLFSLQGELNTAMVAKAFGKSWETMPPEEGMPPRPPVMCPGCPHRGTFNVLKKLNVVVSGDIGCYTLGALSPTAAMDACLCMGASIPMASGMEKARGRDFAKNTVSVIGDSTFFHSGITGLVDLVYNKGTGTVLILDNSTTGMTGHQDNPSTGRTLKGDIAPVVDIEKIVRACGVEDVAVMSPFDMKTLEQRIKESLETDAPSVIIVRYPCALLPNQRKAPMHIDEEACRNCGMCLRLGCPSIEKEPEHPRINASLCNGCGLCASVCPFSAIKREEV